MISEIVFKNLKGSELFSYAADVEFFQKNKSIRFQPGLNILFGPNGCGKSTVLNMAAQYLGAKQGGMSAVTQSWLNDIIKFSFGSNAKPKTNFGGIKVEHDGQPLLYGNPRDTVGLRGGHFDDDFFSIGAQNATDRSSTGFKTLNRLNTMFAIAMGKAPFPTEIIRKVKRTGVNSTWKAYIDVADQLLAGTIPKGQPTIILDEPESGLALPVQGNLFTALHNGALENNIQIIVATHSIFALGLPHANYIDMEAGHMAHVEECVNAVHARLAERAAMVAAPAVASPAPKAKRTRVTNADVQADPASAPTKHNRTKEKDERTT